MKCNLRLIAITILTVPYITAQPGLGELADNINPVIMYGAGLVQLVMGFLGMVFLVYSYSLWRHYKRNPALTHISAVITAFLVSVSCLFFSMSSFYTDQYYTQTQAKPPLRPSIIDSKTQNKQKVNIRKSTSL